jgi:hypothetical protein
MGIEPTSEAWEASILPLYDARSPVLAAIIHKSNLGRKGLSAPALGRTPSATGNEKQVRLSPH